MYLMKDVHGDTAYTLNTNGTKDAGYRYFAFGEQWSHSGSQDNPYRYCGEYIDNETGFIYLRNRYYDPKLGRFISEDPAKSGLNWYVYCENNPLKFVDPWGLIPSPQEAAAMAQHIYNHDLSNSSGERTVEGWRLIDVQTGTESMKMGIYIRNGDDWRNPSEYALVFRGTSTWFDDGGISSEAWNNLEAATSGSSQDMWDAMIFGQQFINSHPGKEVTFVGHSKGGGEAIVAADYMNCNAITFNAANFNFGAYVLGQGTGTIRNYYIRGEILESTIGTASIGETHWLPTQYAPEFKWYDVAWVRAKKMIKAAVANHDIAAVRQAF